VRATHEPMLVRSWRADAPYALQWSDPARDSWIAHVLDRHASAFAEEPAAAIHDHEVVFRALDVDHAALAARHRELSEEITRLKAQGAQLPVQRAADSPSVRRLSPVARDWGYSRGTPIDRHYIELFLAKRASDVRGAVLEIKDDSYARRFGGGAVTHVDTLDVAADNRRATVVGDLRCAATIADETYDCVILTQTAHLIDDMTAVISECARMLRPGGVLLATFPATSRVCVECGGDRDLWRMTPAGARRLCETAFHPADLEVSSFGNMLANTAFLEGLAREDLTSAELDVSDPYFPLLTGVRAVKRRYASHPAAPAITRRHESSRLSHAILLYHRVARPGTDVHRLAVSPERFAEHSAFLQARSEVLSLDAFVQGWQEGTLPPGAVAITFDDGYRDVLESAAPILVRAGLPATCFMTTHRINEPCVFWWDVLEQALLADGPPLPSTFETVLPGEGAVCLPVVSSRQRLEAHWRVYNGVVGLAPEERDGVIRHVRRWAGRPESDGRCRMASHEVRAWASLPGLQIGAHSAWHTILPRQSPAVQRAEAQESKSALESLLGAPVRSFAYPHGAVDEACEAAVRAAGYEYALTSAGPGMSQFVENRWRLPRVEVTPDVSARFEDLMPSR
ncbi:MAG: polysaccharide deacetylase family protein, partial [Vicinamibacterales bacterium]